MSVLDVHIFASNEARYLRAGTAQGSCRVVHKKRDNVFDGEPCLPAQLLPDQGRVRYGYRDLGFSEQGFVHGSVLAPIQSIVLKGKAHEITQCGLVA